MERERHRHCVTRYGGVHVKPPGRCVRAPERRQNLGWVEGAPWVGLTTAGQREAEQRVRGVPFHPHASGQVECFGEQSLGRDRRAVKVLGQAQVEGSDNGTMPGVERAGDVDRLGEVAAGGVEVPYPQFVVTEVGEQCPRIEPVTGLADEP
ncbi:hypothetical protein [Trebonia kvetii]|uniref:hypothetical protein n=1 Tax=Trebonia kvetii TaxID=2480626 RepID=UPI001FEB52C3|nr:hypothetical protein [Trebonia kvetii]